MYSNCCNKKTIYIILFFNIIKILCIIPKNPIFIFTVC